MSSGAKLTEIFEQAAEEIKKTPKSTFNPSNDLKLKMYSLYKQATAGQAKGKRPGMLDPVGRAKFDAWAALEDMSSDNAMQAYIDLYEEHKKIT